MVSRRPLVLIGGDLSELPDADWLTSPGGWVDCSAMTTAAAINAASLAAPAGSTIWLGARPAAAPLVLEATLVMRPRQRLLGAGGRSMLTVIQAGGSFPSGQPLIAAAGWLSNGTVADEPVHVQGLHIDCNGKSGSTGLVVYNFWSHFEDLQLEGMSGAAQGILATDTASNSTTVSSNSHSENTFVRCRFDGSTGGAGGFRAESGNGISNQDGHLKDCFFADIAGYAVRITRAAGWTIAADHFYGTGLNAIDLDACYATTVVDNYVEDFGLENLAGGVTGGVYKGIGLNTILDGRTCIVEGNTVGSLQPDSPTATEYRCYYLRAGSGQLRATAVVAGNAALMPSSGGSYTGGGGAPVSRKTNGFVLGSSSDSGRLLSVTYGVNQADPPKAGWFLNQVLVNTAGASLEQTATLDAAGRLQVAQAPRVSSLVRAGSGSGTFSIDATLSGNNLDMTLTGDATLAVPTGGINTQVLQLVAWASGGPRTLSFDAGYERLGGVNLSYVIPSGKKLRASLRCSTIDGTTDWLIDAAGVTQ